MCGLCLRLPVDRSGEEDKAGEHTDCGSEGAEDSERNLSSMHMHSMGGRAAWIELWKRMIVINTPPAIENRIAIW